MKKAFSLIELVIEIAILSAIAAAILMSYSASHRSIELSELKIIASALAQEKMEVLRNMPYDNLATEHGTIYPPGSILDNEEVERSGVKFKVQTVIAYVDDDFDGNSDGTVVGKPRDIYPYDYKKAEIKITKIGSKFETVLASNFSSKAAETPTNSGIVKLCVVDAQGQPVEGATLSIFNPDVVPPVNIISESGIDGCIMVPNLPPSSQNSYHVSATKEGYSSDQTYPRTSQNPNAIIPDIDVLSQQVSSQTLVIDKLSSLRIQTLAKDGQPLPNQTIKIEGSKKTYFNPITLKYSSELTTDATGALQIERLEFDDYKISSTGKTLVSTSPYQLIHLQANSTSEVKLFLSDNATDPVITSCMPITGRVGENVFTHIEGNNFKNGVTAKLINSTGLEISGLNIVASQNQMIDLEFNLLNAPVGLYDLVITNSDGSIVRQLNAFEVK